jgi:hypothetical protein
MTPWVLLVSEARKEGRGVLVMLRRRCGPRAIAALLGRPNVQASACAREATGVKQGGPGCFEWLAGKEFFPFSI